MVRGLDGFREWFRSYEEQYAIIGGTACDLLMTDEGLDFRATKDLDLVLIVEAVDAAFGRRFWDYIMAGGYEHRSLAKTCSSIPAAGFRIRAGSRSRTVR